jgi:hypothetical protein
VACRFVCTHLPRTARGRAHIWFEVARPGTWSSSRMIGCERRGVSRGFPKRLRVVGVWRRDVIAVEEQERVPWPTRSALRPLFTGTEQAGSWDKRAAADRHRGFAAIT